MDKNKAKRKLLISWSNTYIFYEAIFPLIPKLAENFSISLILVDFFSLPEIFKSLELMAANKLIDKYWLIPNPRNILKHHLFIKSHLEIWRKYNFDILLASSATEPIDRYLSDSVLGKHCIRVYFWTTTTYLLKDETLVKKILGSVNTGNSVIQRETSGFGRRSLIHRLSEKIKEAGSFENALKWIIRTATSYGNNAFMRFLKKIHYFCNRFLFPAILVGKIFPLSKYAKLSCIASEDSSDVFIFCDQLEVDVFKALFKKADVYVARYPTQGNCRCQGIKKKNSAILVPLNSLENRDELPEKLLSIIYRDIRTVLLETGADTVHLRPHPRTKGPWSYNLEQYLRDKGINAVCVSSERPIREVMCDYLGMAGSVSNSFRDAHASCDYAFVVGLLGISKIMMSIGDALITNPRLLFGNAEGIGWIEEDGSYDPIIFNRSKHVSSARKGINEILLELMNKKSR